MNHYLKLIRVKNLAIIAATMFAMRYLMLYPFMDVYQIEFSMEWYYFVLLVLSTVLIAAGGYVINDYVDRDIDEINNPERMVIGTHIDPEKALSFYYGITFVGIISGVFCAYAIDTLNLAFIQILIAGALYYYSTTFKFQGLLGNIVVSLACGLVPVVACVYDLVDLAVNQDSLEAIAGLYISIDDFFKLLEKLLRFSVSFGIASFLITLVREIVKDAEDVEGDQEHDVRTLAVRFGTKTATIVASTVVILLIGFLGYIAKLLYDFENYMMFIYVLALLALPLLIVILRLLMAHEKKDFTRISSMLRWIMVLGLGFMVLVAAIHLL